jgi:hypothetical protein
VADLIYVVVIVAFFGLAALVVVACDRIIGADSQAQSAGAVIAEADDGTTGSSAEARSRISTA